MRGARCLAVVARGDALIDPAVTRSVIARFAALPSPSSKLSARLDEHAPRPRGARADARGITNAEIAAEFVVSEATVKTHVSGCC